MTMKEYNYTYTVSEKDYVDYMIWQNLIMKTVSLIALFLIPLLAIGNLIITLINNNGAIHIALSLFFMMFPLFRYMSIKATAKAQYAQIKERFTDIHVTFQSNGVKLEKENESTLFKWQDLYQIRVKKNQMYVFVDEKQATLIPKSITTKEELEELYNLFIEKLGIEKVIF